MFAISLRITQISISKTSCPETESSRIILILRRFHRNIPLRLKQEKKFLQVVKPSVLNSKLKEINKNEDITA